MPSRTKRGYLTGPDDRYCRRCWAPAQGETTRSVWVCRACGRTDSILRFAYLLFVYNFRIWTFKRGVGAGLLCAGCRLRRGVVYAGLSLLLGQWGPIWTLEVLSANLGGVMPREANLRSLPVLALGLYEQGRIREAVATLEVALKFKEDSHLRKTLVELKGKSGWEEQGPR